MSAIWDTYKYGKENPFYTEPTQKAFYHPSPFKKMDSVYRQISLSPERHVGDVEVDDGNKDNFFDTVGGIYHLSRVGELGLSRDGESVSFDESWPQSERPSTISIPEVENLTPPSANRSKKSLYNAEEDERVLNEFGFEKEKLQKQKGSNLENRGKESTLSRYINRFRHAKPMSREQRLKANAADPDDFWWLYSPVSEMSATDSMDLAALAGTAAIKEKFKSSELQLKHKKRNDLSSDEKPDKEVKHFQEKTNSLMEKLSDQSLGSSNPAVSTVGLGSGSGSMSTIEEGPFRPAFINNRRPLNHTVHPEDDILYRYRMRRKREMAKEEAARRRLEPSYDHLLHKIKQKQPDALSTLFAAERKQEEPENLVENCTAQQPVDKLPCEIKRDAFIQTSEDLDRPTLACIPIACPHMAQSQMISVVGPHCHLNCDILKLTSNLACKDSENVTAMAEHQHKVYERSRKTSDRGNRKQDGSKTFTTEIEVNNENIIQQQMQASKVQLESTIDSSQHKFQGEKIASNNTSKLSRPPMVSQDFGATRHEFSDTEVWQTTDNEDREMKHSFEAVSMQDVHADKGHLKISNTLKASKNSKPSARKQKEPVTRKKSIANKEKGFHLAKNESSPMPIRTAIDQVINDRLLVTSVSSIENLELSSLDLKGSFDVDITDLEEPKPGPSVNALDRLFTNSHGDSDFVIFSDGEEFKDDDILCNLRQRRNFCIQRLKELDHLILGSDS